MAGRLFVKMRLEGELDTCGQQKHGVLEWKETA